MKYDRINSDLFKLNRSLFREKMKKNSVAIFLSNDEHPWNGDATHNFKQNSDLFWLSGVDHIISGFHCFRINNANSRFG